MFSHRSIFSNTKPEPLRPDIEAISKEEAAADKEVEDTTVAKFVGSRSLFLKYRRYQEESAIENRLQPLLNIIYASHPAWSECDAVKRIIIAGIDEYSQGRPLAVLRDFMAKMAQVARSESVTDVTELKCRLQSLRELEHALIDRYGADFASRSLLSPISAFRYSRAKIQAAVPEAAL